MTAGCSSTPLDIDAFVPPYEAARAADQATDVADFFPAADHPRQSAAIVELLRVDQEYAWQAGRRNRLNELIARFGETLSRSQLAEVVFEDYRLRRQAGEAVSRGSYSRRFEISTSEWPELPISEQPIAEPHADGNQMMSGVGIFSLSDLAQGEEVARHPSELPDAGESFVGFVAEALQHTSPCLRSRSVRAAQ